MKSLIEYLAKSIATHPDNIAITDHKEGDYLILNLKTNPQDLGKIIGKKGKTIKALRNLVYLKSVLTGQKARLYLEESTPPDIR